MLNNSWLFGELTLWKIPPPSFRQRIAQHTSTLMKNYSIKKVHNGVGRYGVGGTQKYKPAFTCILHINNKHTVCEKEIPYVFDIWICRVTSDLDLFLRPLVQIDRLDLGDVDPQVSMDTGTANAYEDSQIPGCPSWPWQGEEDNVSY